MCYCRPVGLVVWFSLRVREVPGSTPGQALRPFWENRSWVRCHPYWKRITTLRCMVHWYSSRFGCTRFRVRRPFGAVVQKFPKTLCRLETFFNGLKNVFSGSGNLPWLFFAKSHGVRSIIGVLSWVYNLGKDDIFVDWLKKGVFFKV